MSVTFLTKGKSSNAELDKEIAREKLRQDEYDKKKENSVYRFWMPKDTEKEITFLDGVVAPDGSFNFHSYYEHNIQMNGSWKNWFVCLAQEEQQPCPLCEAGDTARFVGVFSVIDHSEWTDKKGVKHKDELKLYVAKLTTLKLLRKWATKKNGLVGWRVEVSRSDKDNSPAIGDSFEFLKRFKLSSVLKNYKMEGPIPYGPETLPYRTEKDLRELGFGNAIVGGEDAKPLEEGEEFEEL